MKIYLAASFKAQKQMQALSHTLERCGHDVTARWVSQPESEQAVIDGQVSDRILAVRHARQDIDDINRSELVAIFTEWPSSTGGLHFEYGYSLAKRKHIVIIGPMTSVFFALPDRLEWFTTIDEFVDWVRR